VQPKPVRLALLAASPMHYQVPLYRRISANPRLDFTVIFASNGGIRPHDAGYGRPIAWDVDLVGGYRSFFLRKADTNPVVLNSFASLLDLDVVETLVRGRYEVLWLHGYNSATHVLAVLTQKAMRGGLLFREEQTLLHGRSLWKTVVKEVGVRLLFRTASALYGGTENRRWFEHYGVPCDRLFFTPCCVDNERFRKAAADLSSKRREIRREFGIGDHAGAVILTVSRLAPNKNPFLLLEAFRRVRQRFRCVLLIVGSGELESALRRNVRDNAIPDVVFGGFMNQGAISRAYTAADIFALVSRRHETWGLVVNEAMNFGLPIVVSDKVACATDLVRQGQNGFVVPSGDPNGLADALNRLVNSPDDRERFGRASLEIVTDWNHDVTARGVIAAVAETVGPERWNAAALPPP
jgi:glycosyltransferase involved in cell wall biosynthesis